MRVERLLQISVALLAALGSLLLAIGQGGHAALPLMATMAAFCSVYVTDFRGWITLNRNLANFAALIAVLFSFFDFWDADDAKLVAIAKLLIYLQIVLLFQPKTIRVYWHLAVLSLLQVVVAAALNMGVSFGLMLIPYSLTALTTLCLFFVYRETLRVDPELRAAHDAVENRPLFSFLAGKTPDRSETASDPTAAVTLVGQLPANLATVFSSGKMFAQVLKMSFFTLCATVVLFYSFPRFDEGGALGQSLGGGLGTQTGFKDQISLNDMGQILQSDQFVMRVRLTEVNSGKIKDTEYEPYFRGTSLSTYFPNSKTWIVGNLREYRVSEIKPPPPGQDYVRQTIATNQGMRFDRTNDGVLLFSMYPAYASNRTSPDIVDNQTLGVLSMSSESRSNERQPEEYELIVPWHPFGTKSNLRPCRHPLTDHEFRSYLYRDLTQVPLDKDFANTLFPGLRKLATELANGLPAEENGAPTHVAVAERMERYFVNDGNYTYSLHVLPHLKNTRLDPIEDFVVNHKTGHCEFFASALAIMLRTQNIPARVVVGYKGGEYNTFGKYYAVKQKHAHAWVECYLPSDQLPNGVKSDDYPNGAWLRLDPTPASRLSPNRQSTGTIFDTFLDWFDYVELAWRDYVVDMNHDRQSKDIYKPLTDNLVKPFEGWISREQWMKFFRNSLESMGIYLSDEWFSGIASIFTMLILLVLVVVFELCRTILRHAWPHLRKLFAKWAPAHQHRAGFYFKLEKLLAKAGWQRDRSDTPREFIDRVIADCQERKVGSEMVSPMTELLQWYYQIRFGGRTLAPQQQQAIGEHLLTIEQQTTAIRLAARGK
ncbi:DUF3488 and DUF4129 domain-containing transglutaminase family protein [Blastopirellula marina]|uniref:Transglutaminase-like domain-containing protein n=1 Tax=Blastopirellula marina TaxID=124 RepID=A0A2S8G150_9BACT|nr:transglutaminaseTgpA domain-containing protein [Blastopirellula marina]PQO38168.1 hypothetical protein C5Y98_08825 [Blastopirellula marina]PTL44824.1 hypothetical protein C5Y97_08830 [Blastopirellula marina]